MGIRHSPTMSWYRAAGQPWGFAWSFDTLSTPHSMYTTPSAGVRGAQRRSVEVRCMLLRRKHQR
jgi:hypothetical protein